MDLSEGIDAITDGVKQTLMDNQAALFALAGFMIAISVILWLLKKVTSGSAG